MRLAEDPENPDIMLDDTDLIFTTDYAKARCLLPVSQRLVAKTVELIIDARKKGCEIKTGIVVGGFS